MPEQESVWREIDIRELFSIRRSDYRVTNKSENKELVKTIKNVFSRAKVIGEKKEV